MLGSAGNSARNVQVAGKFLAGHAHIAAERYIFKRLCNRAGRADCCAGCFCKVFDQFHIFFGANAFSGGNDTLCLCNRRIGSDAYRKVMAVFFQCFGKCVYFVLCGAFTEDMAFSYACDGSRFFCCGTAAAAGIFWHFSDQVCCDHYALDLVRAFVDRRNLGITVHSFYIHAL